MFEHPVRESIWVEELEASDVPAPVEPKLGRMYIPSFEIYAERVQLSLGDPVSPLEEVAHHFPGPSLESKHTANVPHLAHARSFVLFSGKIPRPRAPEERGVSRGLHDRKSCWKRN